MGRKKSTGAGALFIGLAALVVVIGQFVAEHAIIIAVAGGIAVLAWVAHKLAQGSQTTEAAPGTAEFSASTTWNAPKRQARRSAALPAPTSTNGDAFWVPADALSTNEDRPLGSMLYVGSGLRGVGISEPEPALIDNRLPVARGVTDCRERRLPYWPSYDSASEEARAAYLLWLRTGRQDPDANIGYVFLYFYGLERRALHDARSSGAAKSELPAIESEVKRLLSVYGSQRSFQAYATSFLDFLVARRLPARSYLSEPVDTERGELTFAHRLALAQCAADGAALPARWALTWLLHDPSVALGTAARRCPIEFRALFERLYRTEHGEGMKLPRNRTMLKLQYRAASASFRGVSDGLTIEPGIPDVSVLSSPVKKLGELAAEACEQLGRFSRLIGKDPAAADSFEALVELPIALWPEEYRRQLEAVRDVVQRAGQPASVPFEKFRSWMPSFSDLTRSKLRALYTALSGVGLGMEPDLRFGGSIPTGDSRIVLFADDAATAALEPSARYMAASLTLHLAAAVAAADGVTVEAERTLLMKQMDEWLTLTESERRRLRAHLRLLLTEPPKLTGLKKKIESLDRAAREAIADFLALVAQADDRVTPEEIQTLQKIFRLLGLEPDSVFSKVHVAATESVPFNTSGVERAAHSGFAIPQPPRPIAHDNNSELRKPAAKSGLRLNAAKIASLQKDSERVAAILEAVFDAPPDPGFAPTVSNEPNADAVNNPPSLLGLDAVHSALLQTLLSRNQWARAELEELAEDRDLMLDGALETMNEATFDKFDMALFEAGDPVILNTEAVREVLGVQHQTA